MKKDVPDDFENDDEFLFEDIDIDKEVPDELPDELLEEDDYEDYEEEDGYDDDEALGMSPKLMIGIFVGLIVLAILLCAVLWTITHQDKKDGVPEETITYESELAETGTVSGIPDTTKSENVETVSVEPENPEPENPEPENPEPQNPEPENPEPQIQEQDPISGDAGMEFTQIDDTVTAKDVTNLRSLPSTQDSNNVVEQLSNGSTIKRTGINETTGWSRLDYNGQIVYAVTNYLTTDLNYHPPVEAGNPNRVSTQDGRVIIFVDCDDNVTPKEYVNLRVEPSTSQGTSTVSCQVNNGDIVHRTGYSPDSGWSRVDYNGQVLYVVSSLVSQVAADQTAAQ